VKIDRSFVNEIVEGQRNEVPVVEAILAMAKSLRLDVVAPCLACRPVCT
jgi:EAL domain-containing protein (putative c-di-GMP-specific phosphodiesterase class I)